MHIICNQKVRCSLIYICTGRWAPPHQQYGTRCRRRHNNNNNKQQQTTHNKQQTTNNNNNKQAPDISIYLLYVHYNVKQLYKLNVC